jgi:alkyl sulfatase BDS1-like metallo-beta-lactamase superfamily hydrolase
MQHPTPWAQRARRSAQAATGLAFLSLLLACGKPAATDGTKGEASPSTIAANAQSVQGLALDQRQDSEDAQRGFIAKPTGKIVAADGTVLSDLDAYGFLAGPAPATANPSLWRHAQLNANVGLYKVMDGVYQLRGFDIANITLIEGKTGWIVVDALTSRESAAAAMAFAEQHLGKKPVSALVFTHAHADHFGGALGVVSQQEAAQRKLAIVAPVGFMEEATSENVLVGTGMGRRSIYQFGRDLPRSARGNFDTGLGKDVVYGAVGILVPNRLVTQAKEPMQLDGVDFIFYNVPYAECPAELTFSIPSKKLYNGAENLSHTMHNLLPIRGAKVRDAMRWADYMEEALEQTQDAEVFIATHHWPIWGNARIQEFITKHRDVYQYTHDQTVRLINAGYTPREIAEKVQLPASLANYFGARGYYGDLRHNVKAVYQFYMGFYDGNPAHLNPLPPSESGKRYLELLGGADKAVAAAQVAFDKGDYRWTAELLNHVVMGDPSSKAAKALLAQTYEQMGYASEAATWRNAYLTGAQELRNGPPAKGVSKAAVIDLLLQTPTERFLESMAASLDGPAAAGKNYKINLVLTDRQENYVLWLENAVLHFKPGKAPDANATLALTKPIFVKMIAGTAGVKDTLLSDDLRVMGSTVDLVRFFGLLDKAQGVFPVVTR